MLKRVFGGTLADTQPGASTAGGDGAVEFATECAVRDCDARGQPASQQRLVVDMADIGWGGDLLRGADTPRFPYSRPEFLYFSEEEVALASDRLTRPVVVARDPLRMPLHAGYAETINAGKTLANEDEASARTLRLVQTGSARGRRAAEPVSGGAGRQRAASECRHSDGEAARTLSRRRSDDELLVEVRSTSAEVCKSDVAPSTDAVYFGVFDGHAGSGVSVMAANCLHEHVRERLCQVLETLMHLDRQEQLVGSATAVRTPSGKELTRDALVVGALEAAFVDMDEQIAEEMLLWRIPGGCAAIVALFLLGKLYVANAGDCRALFCAANRCDALSEDFTPAAERKRLQFLAFRQAELLRGKFSRLEYSRFLGRKDLRKKVLYRDWYMDGWAAKTVRDTDLKPPIISDGLQKRRLLNVIGVSRGFGDHQLYTVDDKIPVKPFLTPVPEVRVVDLALLESVGERDVLVLASDGLWDVLSNAHVAEIVRASLSQADVDERMRYTMAAQDLVAAARGQCSASGRWVQVDGSAPTVASADDITVFVVPLKYAVAPLPAPDDDDVELLH